MCLTMQTFMYVTTKIPRKYTTDAKKKQMYRNRAYLFIHSLQDYKHHIIYFL